MQENTAKLPLKVKMGYGVCDIGGNLFFTIVGFWLLNFITDTIGLAPILAGTALMIGKLWDAVTDPMVGYISDRTKSRWGRRLPYILFGSLPLFITCFLMFSNPVMLFNFSPENQMGLFWWTLVIFSLFSTAYTLVNIPYSSLTPELTPDYNERTSLNGFRMSFAVVGTLIGAGAALPIVNAFAPGDDKSVGWMIAGLVFGAVMLITALITFFSIKNHKTSHRFEPPKKQANIFLSYFSAIKCKPYLLILIPWVMNMAGITIVQSVLKYYFDHIYKQSDLLTIAMGILILTALIFIPLWVAISKRIGKKFCYIIGLSIIALNLILFFIFAHTTGIWYAFLTMFLTGFGLSTTYVFPWSIVPDAIEYDYITHGKRREGVFYGMWTFVSKVASAFALWLTGWVLQISGYIRLTDKIAEQPPSALFGIRFLTGPVSAIFFVIGALVLFFYPITKERYKIIRERAQKIESGEIQSGLDGLDF